MQANAFPSRRRFVTSCSTAALTLVAARAGSAATSLPKLRVLTTDSDPGALPLYAQENGFFTSAGLDVDVATMGNGGAILAAVAGDAVEIGFANAGSVGGGVLRGLPFTIIADGALYSSKAPTTLLCVGLDSTIKDAKDLNGKKIAVSGLKLAGQAGVQAWIDKNGGDSMSAGYLEMDFAAMPPLLASGRVDAALMAEPALSVARGKMRILSACFDAIAPEFSIIAYMAKTDWIAKNHDAAAKFAAVIRQTAAWANANPQLSARILGKYMKLPETITSTMVRVQYPTSLTAAHLQPEIDVMAKYGFLAKRVDARTIITQL
jgi:NitT/TauT family transport system substrate-binding protein